MARYLSVGGRPAFLLGANYWSRAGGPRMWERWDEAAVRAELAGMRRAGMNACRAFAFVPSFMPAPPVVDAQALDRLSRLLDLAAGEGVAVLLSALVGHMSGENHDFPGQAGRSLYADPELVAWQSALCAGLGRAARGRVAAWILSNEMPLWAGRAPSATVRAWAGTLCDAVRAADPGAPIGLGDGFMNAKGGDNGFDPSALAPLLDFFGPHTYHADTDRYRQALHAELLVRMLDGHGLPVLLEEFGASSQQASEENQALYLREVVTGCLAIGAAGALVWCFSDLDLPDDPPYRHHAFELSFGVTRADGSEKPACGELRAAAALAASIDLSRFSPAPVEAAIVLPSYFHREYPFSWEDRGRMRRTLLQAFTLCARAGFEARVVREEDDLSGYRLLLVPSTHKLLAPTWERLRAHVEAGAHLYASWFSGDHPFHQGAWCQLFEPLFGLRHRLRYGVPDLPSPELRVRGDGIDLRARADVGPPWPTSRLPADPIDPAAVEVVARDGAGEVAIARRRLGRGEVTFLTYPWEYYLGETPDANERDDTWRLYRLLGSRAGVLCPHAASDPRVTVHAATCGDEELLFVFNRSWAPVSARCGDLFDGDLAPKEARLVRRPR